MDVIIVVINYCNLPLNYMLERFFFSAKVGAVMMNEGLLLHTLLVELTVNNSEFMICHYWFGINKEN